MSTNIINVFEELIKYKALLTAVIWQWGQQESQAQEHLRLNLNEKNWALVPSCATYHFNLLFTEMPAQSKIEHNEQAVSLTRSTKGFGWNLSQIAFRYLASKNWHQKNLAFLSLAIGLKGWSEKAALLTQ